MANAEILVKELGAMGKKVVAAESCTAGLVSDLIASVPGASEVLWGSFVVYTPEAKTKLLGVPEETIKKYGAVSRETACAMAEGAVDKSGCDYAVAVTGLAGPSGDGTDTVVGTVWIAYAVKAGKGRASCFHLDMARNELRRLAAEKAIEGLLDFVHGD